MTMYLKPSMKHQLREYLPGIAIILIVDLLTMAAINLLAFQADDSSATMVTINGFSTIFVIFLFVYGILNSRNDMRVGIQLGVGRRTTFLASLLSAVVVSLFLAILQELLLIFSQVLDGFSGANTTDLYVLIFRDGSTVLTVGQHFGSLVFAASFILAAWAVGCFFSFLFWRLNTIGTIIAVTTFIALEIAIPYILTRLYETYAPAKHAMDALSTACQASSWVLTGLFLAVTAVAAILSWLLVRNANIRGTTVK